MKFFNDFFIPKQKPSATQTPDSQIKTARIASETLDQTGLPMDELKGKERLQIFI